MFSTYLQVRHAHCICGRFLHIATKNTQAASTSQFAATGIMDFAPPRIFVQVSLGHEKHGQPVQGIATAPVAPGELGELQVIHTLPHAVQEKRYLLGGERAPGTKVNVPTQLAGVAEAVLRQTVQEMFLLPFTAFHRWPSPHSFVV